MLEVQRRGIREGKVKRHSDDKKHRRLQRCFIGHVIVFALVLFILLPGIDGKINEQSEFSLGSLKEI